MNRLDQRDKDVGAKRCKGSFSGRNFEVLIKSGAVDIVGYRFQKNLPGGTEISPGSQETKTGRSLPKQKQWNTDVDFSKLISSLLVLLTNACLHFQ